MNINEIAHKVLDEILAMDGEQLLKEVEEAPEHPLSQALVNAGVIECILQETKLTQEIVSGINEVSQSIKGEIKLKTLDEFINELKEEHNKIFW